MRTVFHRLGLLTTLALAGCIVEEPGPPQRPVISDGEIDNSIAVNWMRDDPAIGVSVVRTIYQGRVLLTGHLLSQGLEDRAVAEAKHVPGVREVINNIKLGPLHPSTQSDGWILTKLNTQLTFDPDIGASRYRVQCVDGVVYVLGVADSPEERNRVLNHARYLEAVRSVVDYVLVRPPAPGPGLPPPDREPPPPPPQEDVAPPPDEPAPPPPASSSPSTIRSEPLK